MESERCFDTVVRMYTRRTVWTKRDERTVNDVCILAGIAMGWDVVEESNDREVVGTVDVGK